jgi:CxxC motif-containing protein (DUF1111 family)
MMSRSLVVPVFLIGLQTTLPARNKLRTAPLWGPRMRPRFMHELRSLTLENAIERHHGEAEHVTREFRELTEIQRQRLISFLESL